MKLAAVVRAGSESNLGGSARQGFVKQVRPEWQEVPGCGNRGAKVLDRTEAACRRAVRGLVKVAVGHPVSDMAGCSGKPGSTLRAVPLGFLSGTVTGVGYGLERSLCPLRVLSRKGAPVEAERLVLGRLTRGPV